MKSSYLRSQIFQLTLKPIVTLQVYSNELEVDSKT